MKRIRFRVYFIILILFLFPKSSYACSCPPGPTWVQSYDHSEHIIIGLALEKNVIVIDEVFKGHHKTGDTIRIAVNTSCGFDIEKRKNALIYLDSNQQIGCYPNKIMHERQSVRFTPLPPNELVFQNYINDLNNQFKFQNYLMWLREKKHTNENVQLNHNLELITNTLTQIEKKQDSVNRILFLLIGLSSTLILLTIVRTINSKK